MAQKVANNLLYLVLLGVISFTGGFLGLAIIGIILISLGLVP